MNEINSLILSAVDTVVNARLAKQNKDTTIVAQIYDNANAIFGTYTVKYQNTYFDVYSNDTEKVYQKNASVYILVPLGDMNQRKFILGAANSTKENPCVEITDPNQRYELIGPPITDLYSETITTVVYELPGYKNKKYISSWPYKANISSYNSQKLLEYSKQYEYLQFSADFKYQPLTDVNKCGNYGIEIGFFTNETGLTDTNKDNIADSKNIITYRFDTESMYGDPFTSYNYINRAVTIQCDKGMIYDLAYITIFSEGFTRTLTDDKLKDGEIFVKNINIQFAELKVENEEYTAQIVTPYGVYIDDSPKTDQTKGKYVLLKPQMKQKNYILPNVEFMWFEWDRNIDSQSDKFDLLGGRSWAKIDSANAQNELYYYANDNTWFSKRIKLVAKYGNNIIRTKEIIIYKSANPGFKLEYKKDLADNITLSVVKKSLNDKNEIVYIPTAEADGYTYAWDYVEANGQVIKDNNITRVLNIKQNTLPPKERTYRCYIYSGDVLVDVISYVISLNIEVKEDITVIFELNDNNNGSFLYNENGYIEVEEFTKLRELNFKVWKDNAKIGYDGNNKVDVYNYRWIIDGYDSSKNSIEEEKGYTPNNSMVTYGADSKLIGSGPKSQAPLRYCISSSFNRNKINNTIQLEITYNDTVYYFPFSFSFSKQGDPGTNGTDYQLRVKQTSGNITWNGEKYAPVSATYDIELYYNGEKQSLSKEDLTFSIMKKLTLKDDIKSVLVDKEGELSQYTGFNGTTLTVYAAQNISPATLYQNILSLKVKCEDYYVCYDLPIQINITNANLICNNIFNFVYHADGYEPSYYKDNFLDSAIISAGANNKCKSIKLSTGINKTIFNISNVKNSKTADNSIKIDSSTGAYTDETNGIVEARFKLNNFYEVDKSIDALHIIYNSGEMVIPLIASLNKYSIIHINEWDGNSVVVDGDKGIVYAPQIAAGDKNDANQFTGVLMGEYVVDQENKGIGLWGFSGGTSTFGFSHDGTAYIGESGKGQLLFNPNPTSGNAVIQSANYNKTANTGMQINFTEGDIWAPSFYLDTNSDGANNAFTFTLGSGKTSKFLIQTDAKKPIFNASTTSYYLKSANWDGKDSDEGTEQGLKIDLSNGIIDSKYVYIGGGKGKFTLNIPADSVGSQFVIKAQPTGKDGKGETSGPDDNKQPVYNTIFNATKSSYYLQSLNYMDDDDENSTGGLYINLKDGYIKSPNFNISSSGADFKGKITATSGSIGGWTITAPTYKKDGTIDKPGQIQSSGKQTTLYSNGNIAASGTIKLNEIELTSDGDIKLTQNNVTSTIGLKTGIDAEGNKVANSTPGAMLIDTKKGFAVHANDGNIYLRSNSQLILTVNDGTDESKITMTPTTITFSPDPQAVAVFG